jgi:putative component of toxin-antitoxin plasmid stabilization module
MKKLHSLSLTRLTHLEFGQHIKSVNEGISALNIVVDEGFKNYQLQLGKNIVDYDKGMIQVQKSDETEKIVNADYLRDIAVSALTRYLSVFQWSENEQEVLAHKSLDTLFKNYKGIQSWNFEEESNGIDTLVADLNNAKYLPSVTLLNMNSYVTRVATRNAEFKTIFAGRTQEVAVKEVFDVKKLRAEVKETYTDMVEYVLSMSKTKNNEEFNKSLDIINTVRKYYADLLAKRKPATKTTPAEPIPPMK